MLNLKKVIVLSRTNDIEKAVFLVPNINMKNKDKNSSYKSAFEKRNEKVIR